MRVTMNRNCLSKPAVVSRLRERAGLIDPEGSSDE